jgi:hypothetical protein
LTTQRKHAPRYHCIFLAARLTFRYVLIRLTFTFLQAA